MLPTPHEVLVAALGGLSATGKDVTMTLLESEMPPICGKTWRKFSVGTDVTRKLAAEASMEIKHYMEMMRQNDPQFDEKIDKASLARINELIAEGQPLVIGSRMIPALLYRESMDPGKFCAVPHQERIIRILFTCEHRVRIKRVAKRELGIQLSKAPNEEELEQAFGYFERGTLEHETSDREMYFEKYKCPDFLHPSFFHYELDTTDMTERQQLEATKELIVKHL